MKLTVAAFLAIVATVRGVSPVPQRGLDLEGEGVPLEGGELAPLEGGAEDQERDLAYYGHGYGRGCSNPTGCCAWSPEAVYCKKGPGHKNACDCKRGGGLYLPGCEPKTDYIPGCCYKPDHHGHGNGKGTCGNKLTLTFDNGSVQMIPGRYDCASDIDATHCGHAGGCFCPRFYKRTYDPLPTSMIKACIDDCRKKGEGGTGCCGWDPYAKFCSGGTFGFTEETCWKAGGHFNPNVDTSGYNNKCVPEGPPGTCFDKRSCKKYWDFANRRWDWKCNPYSIPKGCECSISAKACHYCGGKFTPKTTTTTTTSQTTTTACAIDVSKILANDGEPGEVFGRSVSVDGDTIVVGAQGDDDNGDLSGSAYVFVRTGGMWKQQAKLLPDDGAVFAFFGASASVDGDTIVVGASNASQRGAVYVFVRTGTMWAQQAKLLPDDGANRFGISVSVNSDTVVVGADFSNDNGFFSGSAYVFVRMGTTWVQQAKLLPDDGTDGDQFGVSISVDGNTVVVGAQGDDDNGNLSGSAYVFVRTGGTWKQQAKLLPVDGEVGDSFGASISVDGNTVVVGASKNNNGDLRGSAYVFVRKGRTWAQQAKLLPVDGAVGDFFGFSVSVDGNNAVIGAERDDDNGLLSGSAYVFVRTGTTWAEKAKLLPDDGAAGDSFGISVSVDGNTAVIGASNDDDNGSQSGSAYVVDLC